jgi:hypothetical protein
MSDTDTKSFILQFGDKLVNPSAGTDLSPAEALAGKDYVS